MRLRNWLLAGPRLLFRNTVLRGVDRGWLGLTPLELHAVICGFPRSGSTLLHVMLTMAIPHARTFGCEVSAEAAGRYSFRSHPILISKRPRDIFMLPELTAHYARHRARLRALITIRDPRDVLTSFHAPRTDRYYLSSTRWRDHFELYRQVRHWEVAHVVRYEELVSRSERVQEELEAFLDVTMTREFKDFHNAVPPTFQTLGLNGVRPLETSRCGRWREPEHADRIREVLREIPELPEFLIEMGYESDTKWTANFKSPGDTRRKLPTAHTMERTGETRGGPLEAEAGGPLLLFTHSFPAGDREQFLETELEYLASSFSRVLIVPQHRVPQHRCGRSTRNVPSNVEVLPGLFPPPEKTGSKIRLALRALLHFDGARAFLRLLREDGAHRSPRRFARFLRSSLAARALLAKDTIPGVLRAVAGNQETPLIYFYWASTASLVVPFLEPDLAARCVSRFHGHDLYEERGAPPHYLPFQRALLKSLGHPVTISRHGRDYLIRKYPDAAGKCRVFPLGTRDEGLSQPSTDGTLRIVTCGFLVAGKRIDLVIEALSHATGRIEWTHIGDGPLRNQLEHLAQRLPPPTRCRFLGQLSNREVLRHYVEHPCDLFLNVSVAEGLPVSIMEALSCGIPVFATAVGGVPEIVDASVGSLLPADLSAAALAGKLQEFAELPASDRERLRRGARQRWKERYSAPENYTAFVEFLRSIHTAWRRIDAK